MSSRSLALKYRPQSFEDVIGQPVTVQILQNALRNQKIHHAYLFTGPRGIGKTSLARILARAVNCEKGPTAEPCNACVTCREITEGRSLSVLEIDGASNTSVDDVRELRDKIRYLPAAGRYKIYIIDEVHMLSTAAFNALLKTLEEPPPHALFLFATTDPQKIPTTVISRTLRFDLRPIPLAQIAQQLKKIAQQEGIDAEEAALFEIARDAGGSLRDALGLLDQVTALSGPTVRESQIESILGVSPRRFVPTIAAAILDREAIRLLETTEQANQAGLEPKRLALSLLEYLRHLLVARTTDDPALFDLPPEEIARVRELSKKVPAPTLDWIFQLLQQGISDLLRSPNPKILLEVLLLRLCRHEELQSVEEILKRLSSAGDRFPLPLPPVKKEEPSLFDRPKKDEAPRPPAVPAVSPAPDTSWEKFVTTIRSKRPQIASLVLEGQLIRLTDGELVLGFPPQSIHKEMLEEPERRDLFSDLANTFFGRRLLIRCESLEGVTPPPSPQGVTLDEAINIFQPRSTKAVPPELT